MCAKSAKKREFVETSFDLSSGISNERVQME